MEGLTLEEWQAVERWAQATIDDAYWRFTRLSRGVPPTMAVPHAYTVRNKAKKAIAHLLRK